MSADIGQVLRDRRIDVLGDRRQLDMDHETIVDIERGAFGRVSFSAVERYCDRIGLDITFVERVR